MHNLKLFLLVLQCLVHQFRQLVATLRTDTWHLSRIRLIYLLLPHQTFQLGV